MRYAIVVAWMLAFLLPSAFAATPAQADDIAKAQQSAYAWLRLIDAGRYGDSWDAASRFWKADHTKEKTEQVLRQLRAPLGPVQSRRVVKAEFLKVPDGDCVHIEFESDFTGHPSHVESVDLLRELNGEWKVALWSQRARGTSR